MQEEENLLEKNIIGFFKRCQILNLFFNRAFNYGDTAEQLTGRCKHPGYVCRLSPSSAPAEALQE